MTYLDHAATTPVLPEVIAAMAEAMSRLGNPSSLHTAGRQARRAVEESRELLAEILGARPSELIFTSGGTEADNLAVKGIYLARRSADPRRRRVLISAVEHHAVLDSARWLAEHEQAELVLLPVDGHGRVRPETLAAAIAEDPATVALVSVMWANNEVGTIQPIEQLVAVAHEHGIPFHTDAVQAVGVLPVVLRRIRGRCDDGDRAQAGRRVRHRRTAARPRHRLRAGAARRWPGARRPLGHPGHSRRDRLRGRDASWPPPAGPGWPPS